MIEIELKKQADSRRDLIVRVAHRTYVCDSYHFRSPRDGYASEGAAVVLRSWLEEWLKHLRNLGTDRTVFLPFDLSDQCSLWLRCKGTAQGVEICVGSSKIEGWAVNPLAFDAFVENLEDFDAEAFTFYATQATLISDIERSLARLQAIGPPEPGVDS